MRQSSPKFFQEKLATSAKMKTTLLNTDKKISPIRNKAKQINTSIEDKNQNYKMPIKTNAPSFASIKNMNFTQRKYQVDAKTYPSSNMKKMISKSVEKIPFQNEKSVNAKKNQNILNRSLIKKTTNKNLLKENLTHVSKVVQIDSVQKERVKSQIFKNPKSVKVKKSEKITHFFCKLIDKLMFSHYQQNRFFFLLNIRSLQMRSLRSRVSIVPRRIHKIGLIFNINPTTELQSTFKREVNDESVSQDETSKTFVKFASTSYGHISSLHCDYNSIEKVNHIDIDTWKEQELEKKAIDFYIHNCKW